MSEALRALNDGAQAFESEPQEGAELESQDFHSVVSDAPQEGADATPETEPEQQPEAEKKEPKKLSKFELQKAAKERDKRRADQAYAKLQQAEEQRRQVLEENARLKAEAQAQAEKARVQADPILREAVSLLGQGYKPEDVEAEAQRLDAAGDSEGARGARAIAIQMRNHLQHEGNRTQQQLAQQSQTAWRNYAFGTVEFDQAAAFLKPGNQEFDDYWGTVEQGLIERCKASQDPLDQEIGKTFRDHNSAFGRSMVEFLNRTAFGQAFKKHALGMMPAFEMVKQKLVIERLQTANQQLTQELNKARGLTSIAPSAPAGYANGNSSPHYLSPDLSHNDLMRLDMGKFRERLRRRVTD